jgi:hypothetical protein
MICYCGSVAEDGIKSAVDLEYREWMSNITDIFAVRNTRIEELRRESFSRANPEGALKLWSGPVRLDALRKAVEARLRLREEFAQHQPELLGKVALSTLRTDLERFVENSVSDDNRLLPGAGDITAAMRVRIDKWIHNLAATETSVAVSLGEGSPVFVSYSWDNEDHKAWVLALATKLRAEGGINIVLDRWHLALGARSPEFMERSIRESDHVLVVCTGGYKRRFDSRSGGAGYEGHIITAEIVNEVGRDKFIPLLRSGDWRTALPTALGGVSGIDLRHDSTDEYRRLVRHLHGIQPVPPVGPPPVWLAEGMLSPTETTETRPDSPANPISEQAGGIDAFLESVRRLGALPAFQEKRIKCSEARRYLMEIAKTIDDMARKLSQGVPTSREVSAIRGHAKWLPVSLKETLTLRDADTLVMALESTIDPVQFSDLTGPQRDEFLAKLRSVAGEFESLGLACGVHL